MKRIKKILTLVLCLLMVQTVALPAVAPTTVQAAVKNGLKKERGNYYYYVNGKKVTNKWVSVSKTTNGKKVTNRYYFKSNGAAYRSPVDEYCTYNIAMYKINGKWYGFDHGGKLARGVRTDIQGRIWVLDSNGLLNSKKTVALRNAVKNNDLKTVSAMLGKYEKRTITSSCLQANSKDYGFYYHCVVLTVIRNNKTGKNTVHELYTR